MSGARTPFVYVTSDALGPESARVLYGHMMAMKRAGHPVTVFSLRLGERALHYPDLPSFEFTADNATNLSRMLRDEGGVKVATDWRTAQIVADASPPEEGVYLIVELETRHVTTYRDARVVLASYGLGLALVTPSPWIRDGVERLSGKPVALIERGVVDVYRQRTAEADPMRILYVDTGDPGQREELFCAAVREAHELEPRLELALVGRVLPPCGPIPRLRPSTGTDEAAADVLSSAGCLVVTTAHDIADPLRLEAMALGCPVVAVQTPGSVPRVGAEATLLVESEDSHELAAAILRLTSDVGLRDDLVRRGREAVRELTWERHAAGMEAVVSELGGRPRVTSRLAEEGDGRPGVSFVIPTKNAGDDWVYLLRKLKAARDHCDVETIVVDSGSTDDTVALAREHGAHVIEIAPEDFTHGGARNTGADAATKEYHVFLTQDAIPIGESWMSDLLRPLLEDDRVAASTGRDVPRSDADLFCGWMDWNHTGGLTWNEDRIVDLGGRDIHSYPPHEKRSLAQLKDTCCCVRRDVFRRLRFAEVNFAEDLDLGMRLLGSGYKLAMLFSAGVIHSHNREAFYILKRFYVDSKLIPRMLGFTPAAPPLADDLALWSIRDGYDRLKPAILSAEVPAPQALAGRLTAASGERDDDVAGDPSLDAFVAGLPHQAAGSEGRQNALLPGFVQLLRSFDVFARAVHGDALLEGPDALRECYYKLFASAVGSQLGTLLAANEDSAGPRLRTLDRQLSEGV